MQKIEAQKRNVVIMWAANFLIASSMTMVLPFLSLFIDSMGSYSTDYVQKWAGLSFGVTFVTAFLFSPLWGRFGDKFGRKKILIISAIGLGCSVLLMTWVDNVYQLFTLRLFMGVFTGFISTSQALIAAQTPKKISGKVLGTLQTGNVSGALFGPLFGGILADLTGFRYTFFITAIVMVLTAMVVFFGVREFILQDKKEGKQNSLSSKEVIKHVVSHPVLLMIMFVSLLIQAANFSIQPLLALFVTELHGPESNAFFAGLVFSATGLGNLLFTRQWGKIGDRIGYDKVMVAVMLLGALFFFPQGMATSIWQLIVLRILFGVAIGGFIPSRVAFIRQVSPFSVQGEVLGYNNSFRFLGNVIGPMMGGLMAGVYGISFVFYSMSGLFLVSAVLLLLSMAKQRRAHHQPATAQSRNV
ncbi:MFS transporter [Aureibacillus halotolerans]|uniref:Putative MFS family arabinose efflux permease n=1 Tax=Aureibacillus halotolerans TaxID=1508390 RepID=A0A4R6U851_9BACI|nr:MFS transporter [Aureibacillus halotolerans]TDQ42740.1 putative MFS family arabinose efflux permease [Aureibacillus halotolerans]